MNVEYPLRVVWNRFNFRVLDSKNRLWFEGISPTGETVFMKLLEKLLAGMVSSENYRNMGPQSMPEGAAPFAPVPNAPPPLLTGMKPKEQVEQNGNSEKKPYDRAAHMREAQKRRWGKK